MLDLRLFDQRTFSAPVISALLNYGASISTSFLLPFALIQGRGLTPAQTGLVLTCQPIVMAITASFSGALSDEIGSRIRRRIGMAILAIGLFLLSRVVPTTPIPLIVGTLVSPAWVSACSPRQTTAPCWGRATASARRRLGILATARTLGNAARDRAGGRRLLTVLARALRRAVDVPRRSIGLPVASASHWSAAPR